MTLVDKIGAATAVVVFVLLAGAYFYAYRPKNKQQFEDLRNFVNDDDER
ncbi:MAG TPA: cbb3-type cytochrome c oxidase subunit 3 [Candidatus Thioglobus sp.]|jgi:cbb3-type cytochrome oxidase subunit 3|uniref:Cytochrome c oxidase subunit CcoQ n=1 Tax=hydrothermal vent metagenome TaxID=652676 RepID=A0A1W1D726_9ZZZZ|nr:cbb3-type cytochrome c oxidase subunit 3 [Candidatus Thioglobus sp.]HIB28425.1 cbb3-type cytochrome c oxidase subunit 3 [Candidatus Thioglobus sp.]HIB31464.1 cbb3-type cytochrome c oxidase subunit 3 [Candidatus Thioglobus sp.]HIB97021.1 cbb3-type cytochrome c oxidase subunit 3 [Candidatus Thioglobus sp.]HIF47802.1 cbb3-type cytochrome c oxidase subunit 3 [Candidatus Thioglobus sp.]HIL20898.1 cbb3-type cytochrome c oxidase subunit 3 [Candidatus Thioglobus sp.]